MFYLRSRYKNSGSFSVSTLFWRLIKCENFFLGCFREEEMQELNRATNSRMAWLSFLSLGVCIAVAGLQLWHLKTFFERKKLLWVSLSISLHDRTYFLLLIARQRTWNYYSDPQNWVKFMSSQSNGSKSLDMTRIFTHVWFEIQGKGKKIWIGPRLNWFAFQPHPKGWKESPSLPLSLIINQGLLICPHPNSNGGCISLSLNSNSA